MDRRRAFTLIELLVVVGVVLVLVAMLVGVCWNAYRNASFAASANNIRQLSCGAAAYLADHDNQFWPYLKKDAAGSTWWFGYESLASTKRPEGQRIVDPEEGPLAGYVPMGIRPDPSFHFTGKAMKPKYKFGYIGVGYNVLLGGGWSGGGVLRNSLSLSRPGEIVVFATSAQVNTFQAPASSKNPMVEEFYGIDDREVTVHFRNGGQAMVAFADGSAGFLPMDPATKAKKAPQANIGRFAPVGSSKYLLPE